MLVLSRKLMEKIALNDGTEVMVVDIDRGKVRLGVKDPSGQSQWHVLGSGTRPVHAAPIPTQRTDVETSVAPVTCFISYSQKDELFARKLFTGLQQKQIPAWFAPHNMKGGQKISDQLTAAIRESDKILLILSEHSMSSNWVQSELRWAREIEREQGRQKLFPLRMVEMEIIQKWRCFDADVGKDMAVELREFYIPDFTGWEQDELFNVAFARLVRDLFACSRSANKSGSSTPIEVPIYRQELLPIRADESAVNSSAATGS